MTFSNARLSYKSKMNLFAALFLKSHQDYNSLRKKNFVNKMDFVELLLFFKFKSNENIDFFKVSYFRSTLTSRNFENFPAVDILKATQAFERYKLLWRLSIP